jgi:hypothetical protein
LHVKAKLILQGDGPDADCLKPKAELPIERWLGFFLWGKQDENVINFYCNGIGLGNSE